MEAHLSTARYLTNLLENKFKIFGFRFGLDPILGLAPWIGDLISTVIALYIVWIGIQLRVPQDKIGLMVRNIVLDFLVGLIPILGDVSDFVIRSNSKNLEIILKHRRDYVEADIITKNSVQTA